MSDFFKEVDEDYRRDRMLALWKRYQIPLILLAVAIVVGAGGWRLRSDAKIAAAERENARYEAAGTLAKDGKTREAEAAFRAIATDGPAGYAALARFRAAAVTAGTDPEAAATAYDTLAGDDSLAQSLRDTGRFRGALLRVDLMEPKAFEQRYGRFAQEAFTYRNSMRELLALAALKRQDFPAAGTYLDAIIADRDAPAALRGRAEAFRLLVNAGPAAAMPNQPKPATIAPLGQPAGAATPAAPKPPATPPAIPRTAPQAAPALPPPARR